MHYVGQSAGPTTPTRCDARSFFFHRATSVSLDPQAGIWAEQRFRAACTASQCLSGLAVPFRAQLAPTGPCYSLAVRVWSSPSRFPWRIPLVLHADQHTSTIRFHWREKVVRWMTTKQDAGEGRESVRSRQEEIKGKSVVGQKHRLDQGSRDGWERVHGSRRQCNEARSLGKAGRCVTRLGAHWVEQATASPLFSCLHVHLP